eukprot:scaffold14211_cov137-Isochrysis_galbana.AAC.5
MEASDGGISTEIGGGGMVRGVVMQNRWAAGGSGMRSERVEDRRTLNMGCTVFVVEGINWGAGAASSIACDVGFI